MNHRISFLLRRSFLKITQYVVLVFSMMIVLSVGSLAQDVSATTNSKQPDRYEKKTFVDQNGTQLLARTLETEHHVTSDGEIDIQRYRAPSWAGDERVSWEREVRTRKQPDGTVEKEYVLRNPDGTGQLVPIRIIREKATPAGDSTVVHREILQRLGGGELQAVQKEQITEKGPDNATQVFKEVQRLDTASHEWQTVERETSSVSTTTIGNATKKETKSVRQTPNAYGGVTDYERRQERTVSSGGKETHEATVYRRDNSTSDPDRFFLLDHTTETTAIAPGNTTRNVVRESERNMYSHNPEVVSEQTVEEKTAPDGSRQTVTNVRERTASDPSVVRAVYTVVEESNSTGYVRRIFIPAE
jgi:hypothetical protein